MKYILILLMIFSVSLIAKDKQITQKEQKTKEAIQKAIEDEKKFAKEQKFYQGGEYDLKSQEIDPSSLKDINIIKPQDDFDMDDVY